MSQFERYYQAVRFLEGLGNISPQKNYMTSHAHPEMYLKRMRYLLKLLGNPEKGQKYIHVTGTAGKGTVANMIYQVLLEWGKTHPALLGRPSREGRSPSPLQGEGWGEVSCLEEGVIVGGVGLFTSPFSTTTIEKISVNGTYISPDEFAGLVDGIKPALDIMAQKCPYGIASYFEICTALALQYFNVMKCAWVVLEVGCGGRYDSTNVIPAPVVAVITNIGLDHTKILGSTVSKIAYEKAGIIKKGCCVYTAEQRPRLRKIFQHECDTLGAILFCVETSPACPPLEGDVSRKTGHRSVSINKALVQMVTADLGISQKIIDTGIAKAKLPCRFEIIQKNPIVILDGAHNELKLASTIENLKSLSYKKLYLIIALSEGKQVDQSLNILCKKANYVICTRFQEGGHNRAVPPQKLAQKVKQWAQRVHSFLDPFRALEYVLSVVKKDDAVLITGSFYLAGDLRKRWVSEEMILAHRTSFP